MRAVVQRVSEASVAVGGKAVGQIGAGLCVLIGVAQGDTVDDAEWLAGRGQPSQAEPLLAEAREIFERLQARPWLERVTAAAQMQQPQVPA